MRFTYQKLDDQEIDKALRQSQKLTNKTKFNEAKLQISS